MDDFTAQFNNILVRAYHNVLLMEETKRKHSRTTTSFRGRNAMEFLYKSENGEKKISEIADYLKISRPSATALIKKLETFDYVRRKTDKADERSTIVSLTRKADLLQHCRLLTEIMPSAGYVKNLQTRRSRCFTRASADRIRCLKIV